MNRKIFWLVIFFVIFNSVKSFSNQIKINITATLMENTCIISTASTDFLVNLISGDLRGKDIGIPFGETPFYINLDSCPENLTTAHVKFTSERDPIMPELLKIQSTDSSSAKGVAIGLFDKDNNNVTHGSVDIDINHDGNKNIFPFSVAYLKTGSDASPGKIIAVTSFEIAYD